MSAHICILRMNNHECCTTIRAPIPVLSCIDTCAYAYDEYVVVVAYLMIIMWRLVGIPSHGKTSVSLTVFVPFSVRPGQKHALIPWRAIPKIQSTHEYPNTFCVRIVQAIGTRKCVSNRTNNNNGGNKNSYNNKNSNWNPRRNISEISSRTVCIGWYYVQTKASGLFPIKINIISWNFGLLLINRRRA